MRTVIYYLLKCAMPDRMLRETCQTLSNWTKYFPRKNVLWRKSFICLFNKSFKVFMQEGIYGQTLKFSENSVSFFLRIPKRTVQYIGHQVSNLRSSKLAVAWSCTANFLLSLFIFSELHLFSWSINATEIFRYCSLYNSPPNSGDGYCSSCLSLSIESV